MSYDLLLINSDIDANVMQKVLSIPREQVAARLVVVIDTYGGSPNIAYRSMHHLGALYEQIDFVVPDKAMSAGTLMCVGANTIYMYEGSSLGPLDLQIPHPTDGGQISTLDIRESTYDIFGLTTTIAKDLYEQAINDMKLGKNQAAKITHDAAVSLLNPIVDKIDPYHLHASYRTAIIGQKYARILLASRMMKNNLQQAAETSKTLAENYEMHSYSITMEEAKDYLKLNVKNIIQLDVLPGIQSYLYSLPKGVIYTSMMVPPTPPQPLPDKQKMKEDKDGTKTQKAK